MLHAIVYTAMYTLGLLYPRTLLSARLLWWQGEFSYALNRRRVEKLIPIVMEPACLDTSSWQGVVGMRLGSQLYIDLSMDANQPEFTSNLNALIGEIHRKGAGQVKQGAKPLRAMLDATSESASVL